MTRDEFSAKYKLLKPLTGGDGRSYTAEHRPTGRAVLVHFLPGESASAAALPELIARLGPRDGSKITDTLSVEGSAVVVSEFIEVQGSFEQWLRVRSGAPATAPISASSVLPNPIPRPGGGEFTQLFRNADGTENGHESPPRMESPPAAAPAAPAALGSFTALFQPPADTGMPADLPRAEPAGPSVPMLSLRVPPPTDEAPVVPPASPSSVHGIAPEGIASPPPVILPRPVFAVPPVAQPPVSVPPPVIVPPPGPGGPRHGFVLPTIAGPAAQPAQIPPAPIRQGPSDYTRILGAAGQLRDPSIVQAAASPDAAPPAPTKSYLPLWLLLNVVLILGTGLVVYFALKRC